MMSLWIFRMKLTLEKGLSLVYEIISTATTKKIGINNFQKLSSVCLVYVTFDLKKL